MKYLLSFLLVAALFSFNETPKERYFLIGYASNEITGSLWFKFEDGKFPVCEKVIERIRKVKNIEGKIAITSLYEFNSKADFETFNSLKK